MKKWIAGTLLFVLLIAAFINNEGKRYNGYDPDSPYIGYSGPMYSVVSLRDDDLMTVQERNVSFDFSTYQDDWFDTGYIDFLRQQEWYDATMEKQLKELRQFKGVYSDDVLLKDTYTIQNHSSAEETAVLVYPFVSNISEISERRPELFLNGQQIHTDIRYGYVWNGARRVCDNSNQEYRELLKDNAYLDHALSEERYNLPDLPCHVYKVTYEYDPQITEKAPFLRIRVSYDPSRTALTGFYCSQYPEDNEMVFSMRMYDPQINIPHYCLILAAGEKPEDIQFSFFENGDPTVDKTSDQETPVYTEIREMPLEEAVRECSDLMFNSLQSYGQPAPGLTVSEEQFFECSKELMSHFRLFEMGDPAQEFSDLGDLFTETLTDERLCFAVTEISVQGNDAVTFEAVSLKKGSQCWWKEKSAGKRMYELAVNVGNVFRTERIHAVLKHTDTIEIVENDMGFEGKKGILETELDPQKEYYTLIVKRKK